MADKKDPHRFILSCIHSTNTKCLIDVKFCSRHWGGNAANDTFLSSWSFHSSTGKRARGKQTSKIRLERAGERGGNKTGYCDNESCLARYLEKVCLRMRPVDGEELEAE